MKSAVWIIVCVVLGIVATYHPVQAAPPDFGSAPQPKPIVKAVELPQTTLQAQDTLESILYPVSSGLTNNFDEGQCTFGVASRLPVTWSGNADEWAVNAAAQGYEISSVPKVGSIAQTTGDSWAGHVAIVTAVALDGTFTVWEENYYGLGVTDERTTSTQEFQNFIYF